MAKTSIEWVRNEDGAQGDSWNPVSGCTKVSPGCDNCYAETIAHRFAGGPAYPNGFDVTLRENKLRDPLRWKGSRAAFVCSMADLFNSDVPDEYIAKVFATMACSGHNTFMVLTKRAGRMRSMLSNHSFVDAVNAEVWKIVDDWTRSLSIHWHAERSTEIAWPLPNVRLGVSVEDQARAELRIGALLATPAHTRYVSMEPLLAPVDVSEHVDGLDWVICGGESGRTARPMHPDWARQIRDACVAAEVPFLFKQWGEWTPIDEMTTTRPGARTHSLTADGQLHDTPRADAVPMIRAGKHAGRTLDGDLWDQFPATATKPPAQPPAVHRARRGEAAPADGESRSEARP